MVITSNNEKELPDAFLRRCVFHFIDFPDAELMKRIVAGAPPGAGRRRWSSRRWRSSTSCATLTRLRKRPSTSELIDWIAVLEAAGIRSVKLEAQLPFLGALLKKEQDLEAFAEARRSAPGCAG